MSAKTPPNGVTDQSGQSAAAKRASTGRPDPLLAVEGLTAGYSRVPVVKDVSLDLALGEVVLVMGPNGAGKSTLVKAITGQLPLISGRVSIEDTDVSKMREEDRVARGIGYVPQRRDVFGPLSVLENLQMGAFRVPAKEVSGRIAEVLELFPALPALTKRHAKTLSGGERKMVAIARALVADPRLLILDEPTSNLAPQIATTVLTGVVRRVAEAGRAVLLIEQRVSLALEIASWGYLLTDGQVRLQGSAEHFRSRDDLGSLFLGRGGMGMSHADEHPHDGAVRT